MSDLRFQVVRTDEAPPPLPQFSQAVVHNGMIYCSGNIGALPNTNFVLVQGTVKDRRQALKNLSAVLEAGGSKLENVVKMNIYITTMKDFGLMNEAYDEFFTWPSKREHVLLCMSYLSGPTWKSNALPILIRRYTFLSPSYLGGLFELSLKAPGILFFK
ncbi:endoribonuclease l-PSP domain-containing protein [Pochonia chlamydosporia 170]|uniref:Endoribonuclease l-PSP domain-containing protein n=1 Tax=Pochonia chlamydosporia 170 TaxID=1380566 RepID=A0A179F4N1_METCM|nr:endoribonuclease l-PSP domain-containing protein [Pochonia chlamydosporia 170]OAQ60362.1 endoribonuclease l-PSP domain-containing protein [Pochonia chlamydosporia 170]